MDLKNWTVRTRDIETGHEFYAPNDDLAPIVLSSYGKYYRVIGFWAIAGKVLWLDLFRTNKEGVVVNATLSPDELMGVEITPDMDLGLWDEIELHKLLNKQIAHKKETEQ